MNLLDINLKKSLGKYFTRDLISDLLISSLSIEEPNSVLDLGSGDGSLSKAAARRWDKANFFTVDIHVHTAINEKETTLPLTNHKHFLLDALEPTLVRSMGINHEAFDLALCNPPFVKPKWNKKHLEFLVSSGYSPDIKGVMNVSAEVFFIIQNLLFLKKGGKLGIIIPDGFISGEKSKSFREYLLSKNSIDKVIKLPKNAFIGTHVQAHILIITKGYVKDDISIETLSSLGCLKEKIIINKDDAVESLDYDFHKHKKPLSISYKTLGEIGCKLYRGRYNSKECRESKFPIFHTVDFKSYERFISFGSTEIDIKSIGENQIIAEEGDILLCRVGRNLASKISLVTAGKMPISDCIYKLSVPLEWRQIVFDFLCSEKGRLSLQARSKGTGAMYLAREMLLNLPVQHAELEKK
ncbi:HsdM family class I SAM-dependent methyltransferase [Cronobacter dublinensis]|uniref:HsdM family class I SAM-dependent methyltransferase n=1 Tax=Cronobacter dublinensis TaxID=413497 RepID=UPI00300DE06D